MDMQEDDLASDKTVPNTNPGKKNLLAQVWTTNHAKENRDIIFRS